MKISQLQSELSDMKVNMDTLEKERDFYFSKLRDIEVYIQANPNESNDLVQNILKILYASEEEKVVIGENGELTVQGGDEKMQE